MVMITNLNRIKKSVASQMQSGNLELFVLPRVEYEALLERLANLEDLHDSIKALKEYQSGKYISFDRYDARREVRRT